MRGKKPKPAALQIAEGDPAKRGVHKLDAMLAAEPKVESGLPPASPRLRAAARDAYEFYREELNKADLAKRPDAYALERAAQNPALIWKADEKLAREGEVVKSPILAGRGKNRRVVGYRHVKSKWLMVRAEAEKNFRAFASEFGLTGPASRVRLGVQDSLASAAAERELWEILSQPRSDEDDPPDIQ